MGFLIRLHPLIANDYEEAYSWYESKLPGLGERFLAAVRLKIESIAAHPQNFSSKGNLKFREAIVDDFPFVIVYKINKRRREVLISSIHHMKKHPRKKYRKG
jgi:plasmid stabilization system protein ParE